MMNYCDKIKYRICAAERTDFPLMVDSLLSQLRTDERILRLVFIGMPESNAVYLEQRTIIRQKVNNYFGSNCPSFSYVAQPPLRSGLLMEIHGYETDESDEVSYRVWNGLSYVVLENPQGRFLYAGGFQDDFMNLSMEKQSVAVFEQIGRLLAYEAFPVNSIVRQWNYIEKITGCQGDSQNYQVFNDARSLFYETTSWPDGYPAATGIGAHWGGIVVDLDAVIFKQADCFATPIDNKLQVAAHAYSTHVLADGSGLKATPKFERAKRITFGNKGLIYISGTAAIRGEESMKGVGLAPQLQITMENIFELTGQDSDISMLRVYLKEKSFVDEAEKLMQKYVLSVPVSYMWTDVCREELLIEIEGIALC